MSYLDEEEPVPPTVVERLLATIERERSYLLDLCLLVIVAASLGAAGLPWAAIGFTALLAHTILTYRS